MAGGLENRFFGLHASRFARRRSGQTTSAHPCGLVALETDDREVEVWLEAGAVDLGVVLNPPPERGAVPIGRDAWVGVLPAGHRLSRRGALSLAELGTEPFVLATGGCHVHARSLAETAGLTLCDVRMEVRDWTSAIALVREGVGVGIVPCPKSSKVCASPGSTRRSGAVLG
jgi:DNA-binding transcriptional LysR family regulator